MKKAVHKTHINNNISLADKDRDEKQKLFLEKYESNFALKYVTCSQVGVNYRTVFIAWRKKYKDFADRIEEIERECVDKVVSKLVININKGEQRAIEYYLNNRDPKNWKSTRGTLEHNADSDTVQKLGRYLKLPARIYEKNIR